jgi:acid phosphatase type 7
MPRLAHNLTLAAALTIVLACEDTAPTDIQIPTSGPGSVQSVVVTPSSAELAVGEQLQLSAKATSQSGQQLGGTSLEWSTTDSAVADVSSEGIVTGVAAGSAAIVVAAAGKGDTAAITVPAGAPPPGPPPPPPPFAGQVFVGAGDIADCESPGDEATAALLDSIDGTVFLLGDNAYESGKASEFANCYDPSWGRHKSRTRPAPGNHDYYTRRAAGYFGYFGAAAGDPSKGYYSFDLGDWHILSLNSNIPMKAGSKQEQWVRADLATSQKRCQIAYWHHPRFTSGTDTYTTERSAAIFTALYEAGVEVVLGGHEHLYERLAPQTPAAELDRARGVRQFVVGTGGRYLTNIGKRHPNSEVINNATWGVLKLSLGRDGYAWDFVPVAGSSFTDSGSDVCH